MRRTTEWGWRVQKTDESDASDDSLILRLAAGDDAAFALLLDRHLGMIHRLAWRLLGDRSEAEDVAQESLLRLWNNAATWRPGEAGLKSWLYRVAFNLSHDRLRRRRLVLMDEPPETVDPAPRPGEAIEEDERGRTVRTALDSLPERQRAALVLSYYEGLSQAEAAGLLEISEEALESLLARGRRKLRELLGAEGRDLLEGLS